ncbi:MAG: DUF3267 domain-containing protein [Anaerolineales bacterium]
MTNKKDFSISMNRAVIYSLIISIPLAFLFGWLYSLRWGFNEFMRGFDAFFANLFLFLFTFILGVILHEFIHGFTWMLAGKKPFSAIKFGFQLKTFTPYAHCKEPLNVNAYRIGAFMPGLLMGIAPSAIAILTGNGWLITFGIVFTTAAGGDFVILWLIRNVSKDKFVEDHPSQAGCYVVDEAI